jgi:hypothetical protein
LLCKKTFLMTALNSHTCHCFFNFSVLLWACKLDFANLMSTFSSFAWWLYHYSFIIWLVQYNHMVNELNISKGFIFLTNWPFRWYVGCFLTWKQMMHYLLLLDARRCLGWDDLRWSFIIVNLQWKISILFPFYKVIKTILWNNLCNFTLLVHAMSMCYMRQPHAIRFFKWMRQRFLHYCLQRLNYVIFPSSNTRFLSKLCASNIIHHNCHLFHWINTNCPLKWWW